MKLTPGWVLAAPSDPRALTLLCAFIWTQTPSWKEISCISSPATAVPGRYRSGTDLHCISEVPLGSTWIKLYKWTNLPRLTDMAVGGIRGCQLLLSHLGRKASSEVLCVALWSLQLLSHLSCQEKLNSSTILLTLCKGKYILPKAHFADPGYFTISVNLEILLSGHIFLPINLGSVICCPRRKSLLC